MQLIYEMSWVVHYFKFFLESYAKRAAIRKALAGDADWIAQATPMLKLFEKQDNLTMRLFPWSKVQEDVKPGGWYYVNCYYTV